MADGECLAKEWQSVITGWTVAVTCYISHSAKHRKMADFDPSGSQNPLTNFDETWLGWLSRGSHDPTPHDNFGGGNATWVVWENMWLVICPSFFLFFAFFSVCPGRISWPISTIYTPKRVFLAKDVPFGGLNNIRLHLGVKLPKKPPPNGRQYAFCRQISKVVK